MCLLGTVIELLIHWLEPPLESTYGMSMPVNESYSSSNAPNMNPIIEEPNLLGSKESLSGDFEPLLPPSSIKTSLKGIH